MGDEPDGYYRDEHYVVGNVEVARFEDVSEEMGYDYRGYNYIITIGEHTCHARKYDHHQPHEVSVTHISPPSHGKAFKHPEAQAFRNFIVEHLGARKVEFLGHPDGTYGELPE